MTAPLAPSADPVAAPAASLAEAEETRRRGLIDGLRALADFYEATPDMPLPYAYKDNPMLEAHIILSQPGDETKTELARIARLMGRAQKETSERLFYLTRSFGPVALQVLANRDDVCERVVVSTEEVTREVPDPDALAAVPTVTVTETVEEIEWRCPPSLLVAGDDAARVALGVVGGRAAE